MRLFGAFQDSVLSQIKRIADVLQARAESERENSQTAKPEQDVDPSLANAVLDVSKSIRSTYRTAARSEDRYQCRNLIVAIVGVLSVVAYTTVAYIQSCATQDAAKAAQDAADIAKRSQRSYISVGKKDGVVAAFVTPKDPTKNSEIVIFFQNTGRVPARFAWGIRMDTGYMILGSIRTAGIKSLHEFKGLPVALRDKTGKIMRWSGGTETSVIAGDSVFVSTLGVISHDDLEALPRKLQGVLLPGKYQYCDDLGNFSEHDFSLGYRNNAPISDLTFSLVTDTEVPTAGLPNPCDTSNPAKK
jgi:hypothetical protein